jgi:hypothetical protein
MKYKDSSIHFLFVIFIWKWGLGKYKVSPFHRIISKGLLSSKLLEEAFFQFIKKSSTDVLYPNLGGTYQDFGGIVVKLVHLDTHLRS